MSVTSAFRVAHKKNPTWGYKELAAAIGCDVNTLRGINNRIKLPIPVSPKFRGNTKPTPRKRAVKALVEVPPQQGSGRKQYGGYLKLL
jgi:hypothetical protein